MYKRGDIFKFSKVTKEDFKFLPKSHKEAKKLNSKYYYKPKTCINGHDFLDYTNGGCVLCYVDRYYKNNHKLKETRLENLNNIIQIFIEFELKKDKKFSQELLKHPSTIEEAEKKNTNTIFERKPCISKGHFSERIIIKKTNVKTFCKICTDNWAKDNPEKILISSRASHEKHKDKRLKSNRIRRKTREFKNQRNKQRRQRYKKDINYRIEQRLRARVNKLLKGFNKSEGTKELVGCDIDFLKKYLEGKFTEGMSWKNYKLWHIDHIKPCSLFDLSKQEEQKKCFNYKNLQPMWAEDNLSKGGTNRIYFRSKLKLDKI